MNTEIKNSEKDLAVVAGFAAIVFAVPAALVTTKVVRKSYEKAAKKLAIRKANSKLNKAECMANIEYYEKFNN